MSHNGIDCTDKKVTHKWYIIETVKKNKMMKMVNFKIMVLSIAMDLKLTSGA